MNVWFLDWRKSSRCNLKFYLLEKVNERPFLVYPMFILKHKKNEWIHWARNYTYTALYKDTRWSATAVGYSFPPKLPFSPNHANTTAMNIHEDTETDLYHHPMARTHDFKATFSTIQHLYLNIVLANALHPSWLRTTAKPERTWRPDKSLHAA